MERLVLLAAVLAGPLLAAAVLFGRSWVRRPRRVPLSAVTQQHLHLFQGGRLGEAAVEAAKARLRELLRTGGAPAAEASLRPGEQYVVQVQALAKRLSPRRRLISVRCSCAAVAARSTSTPTPRSTIQAPAEIAYPAAGTPINNRIGAAIYGE